MAVAVPQWADLGSNRSVISGRMTFLAQVVGWLAFGVGVVVLVVGWWLDQPSVASLIPGQVTMKANTAVGIALTGIVVVGVARGWNRWVPGSTAAVVLLIGVVTVLEYVLGSSWSGLDELLARERLNTVATAFPGRMGANTAVDMVVMGTAGMLLTLRKAPGVRQALAVVVVAVATVAILGYALQVPAMSGHVVGVATRMALNTSVLHLLLGVALLVVATDRGWAKLFASPLAGGRIARVWTPALLIVVAIVSVLARTIVDVISGNAALGQQLGLSMSTIAVGAVMVILAGRTDQLDQERLREAAIAVDRSERLYRLGFDFSPVGIALLDRAGNFLDVNRAFSALLGKPAQAITGGESIATVSEPSRVSMDSKILEQLFSGDEQNASFETALLAADGRSIPVQWDIARVDFARETVLFGHVNDLTHERETQRCLEEKNLELSDLAERDALTGILNRRTFLDYVQAALDRPADDGSPSMCAVLFIDVDDFKRINDVFGHQVGDRVLCAVADRLTRNTKEGIDWIARVGGDEFAVLLTGYSRLDVDALARRLDACLRDPFRVAGVTLKSSCSVGYAVADGSQLDCEEFMARADQNMYATRRAGRGGLSQKTDELREAIHTGQLVTHFQPIWKIGQDSHTVHAYEALVRWQHPEKGLIPPHQFIGTAEVSGLIHQLDMWVGKDAMTRIGAEPRLNLAVNCSALTLCVPGFAGELLAAVSAAGRDPRSIIVELTESVEIPESSQIMNTLTELRREGIQIALDDFGAGYAGLNNLRTLPIDLVKIDRSLIVSLAEDSREADHTEHFLLGIRQLTDAMGTQVLAEGIETARQLDLVQGLGFDYAQGFFLGKPTCDPSLGHLVVSSGR
ncbi:MAG: EAL domain-containing protein [Actinomycetia bacterium]|nr:EAL domain-containing protein [Actinomycetes bacterium]